MDPGVGESIEIRLFVPFGFLPEAVGHTDPGLGQHQLTERLPYRLALVVTDLGGHARHARVEGHRGNRFD
ncbi:hypothetical protein D3C84_1262860 [compost metagenome]